jgi:hypothetical protein
MDNSNLFSYTDVPEYVASGETSEDPVEYPTFSEPPDTEPAVFATQRS